MQDLNAGVGTEKLICDLKSKTNYKVHHRLLQFYLALGLKVTKVHSVVQFQQSKWMQPYIQKNTEYRNLATSDFEKDFWKVSYLCFC